MLLKIYTCQNTVKIIDSIEDAEIHENRYQMNIWAEVYESHEVVGGVRGAFGDQTQVECYDWKPLFAFEAIASAAEPLPSESVRFVDYWKNDKWHRVAILKYAYLCNDEGRTIQKIG